MDIYSSLVSAAKMSHYKNHLSSLISTSYHAKSQENSIVLM
jgi:hypothetical protein